MTKANGMKTVFPDENKSRLQLDTSKKTNKMIEIATKINICRR